MDAVLRMCAVPDGWSGTQFDKPTGNCCTSPGVGTQVEPALGACWSMARALLSQRTFLAARALSASRCLHGSAEEPRILHDANEWLVLHKPAGWHSVAQRRSDVGGPATVEEWLHRNVPGQDKLEEAGLCNRLDFVTSGCILAAKNARTHGVLCRALKRDDIRKYYLALVAGTFQTGQGSFKLCFTGRYRRSKKVSVSESGPQRSQGSCAWRVLARDLIALPALAASTRHGCPRDANASIRVSLIQVELLGAGQRHQIRAGMAYLGTPIVGDTLYGGPDWLHAGIALHSNEICLFGTSVCSPLPPHIGAFLETT